MSVQMGNAEFALYNRRRANPPSPLELLRAVCLRIHCRSVGHCPIERRSTHEFKGSCRNRSRLEVTFQSAEPDHDNPEPNNHDVNCDNSHGNNHDCDVPAGASFHGEDRPSGAVEHPVLWKTTDAGGGRDHLGVHIRL